MSNGRVTRLKGDDIDPMSKGRMCPKGLSGIQALYHPNRNKYPMKRVGDKPGNQWERISWDEACETVAQAMMDMAEKTGKHGLLCTTGGGGNPQFFSPRVSATSGVPATCSNPAAPSAICRATTRCR